MSVVINIFAAIGLIVIISYIVYYMYEYFQNLQTQQTISQMNPPDDYMQTVGLQCPDYWVNNGIDSNGNYICENKFNIPTTCTGSSLTFSPITAGSTWQYGNPNGLTSMSDTDKYNFLTTAGSNNSYSRCDWINKCGPNANTQGIWQGVNELCNSPPSS